MPRKRKGLKRELSDAAVSTTSSENGGQPCKRLRPQLCEEDEDRLGRLVGLSAWLDRIQQGRGAAVCLSATIEGMRCVSDRSSPLAHFVLRSDDITLTCTFHGKLADRVFNVLGNAHPAHIYLSGFAASLTSRSRVEFQDGRVSLRISPAGTAAEATWVEVLEATQPLPEPATLQEQLAQKLIQSRSPFELNDWFSTPAPDGKATVQHHGLPPPPPQPARAISPSNSIQSKPEPASSSHSSPRPDTFARSSSASVKPAPPRSKRNYNHSNVVAVRTLGSTEYTPISLLRNGERCNIAGVVINTGGPRRASGGTRDLNLKINIADMSCAAGQAANSSITKSLTIMLFAPEMEQIPHPIKQGQIILLRRIIVQDFSGRTQGVGKRDAAWAWAIYDPESGELRISPMLDPARPVTEAETDYLRDLAIWYADLQSEDLGALASSSRPTLRLEELSENLFFDSVVQVVKVYTHSFSPDLYVTDYTAHPLFFRGNDQYLPIDSPLPYVDNTDGWGSVFQIGLWDSHAQVANGLQIGDIIRIQNVRAKMNPRGMLVGGLGSSTDSGLKIRTLKSSDEARKTLERRKDAFLQRLVDAEEVAVAERAEREAAERAAQPQIEKVREAKTKREADVEEPVATVAATPDVASLPPPGQGPLRSIQPPSASMPHSSGSIIGVPTPPKHSIPIVHPPTKPQFTVICKAPTHIPLTLLSALTTTSTCPGMYRIRVQITDYKPTRVQDWARIICPPCSNRLLPIDQLFCTNCNDPDSKALEYTFRFALMVTQGDTSIPVLFHGKVANEFLGDINPRRIVKGRGIEELEKRVEAMGQDEVTLAIYSYLSGDARRFAALQGANLLRPST